MFAVNSMIDVFMIDVFIKMFIKMYLCNDVK